MIELSELNPEAKLDGVTVIIDGNSVAYRAFFKAPPLMADDMPTGVIHVFLSVLDKLSRTKGIVKVIAVFDARGKNKRHELMDEYKATREAMPEDLSVQIEALKGIIPFTGTPLYCEEGYEADDVIYTLTRKIEGDIWLVTKDKDLHQLVDGRVKIYDYQTGDIAGREEVFLRFGVYPEGVCDMLSLAGDSSDNIPGVAGVGPKTAVSLLEKYKDLDGVYAHVEEVKGKMRDKLLAGRESAYLSRRLVELIYIPDLEEAPSRRDEAALRKIYEKYRLKYHLIRLGGVADPAGTAGVSDIFPDGESEASPYEEGPVERTELVAFAGGGAYAAGGGRYEEYSGFPVEGVCYDVKSLIKAGADIRGRPYDLMLASWLDDPDSGGLKQTKTESLGSFLGRAAAKREGIEARLKELGLESLYYDMELPVARILAETEKRGIGIDSSAVRDVASRLKTDVVMILAKISNRADADINVNSPKQLASYLYDTLGLKPPKKNKRGYSTDEETLLDLRDSYPDKADIIDDILKYRELNKLLSTYTVNMLEYCGADGRIHTEFKQTGTATGRLSSTNPNLQNIPQRGPFAKALRAAFVAREGYSFVSFDYSQIELRILAHMSGDPTLISSFMNDIDIHTITARSIFHLAEGEEVTSDLRRIAKAVNFGILYGLSAFGLARDTRVPASEARVFIERYFSLYKDVRGFIDGIIEKTRRDGFCETILGRKRFIADIASRNANIRQRAERMAVNAPVQGSAADIIKLAMIECDKYIKESGADAGLILQIHDELVFEVADGAVADFRHRITEIMESVFEMKVPLVVNSAAGKNWGEL